MASLYPPLPGESESNPSTTCNTGNKADSFRLMNITETLKYLEGEQSKYARCKRRYNAASNSVHTTNMVVAVVSAGCAAGGVALFATGVGSVIGIAIEGVSVFTCAVSFGLGAIEKRLHKKLQKHEALSTLAGAKLSSMKLIISKSLEDNKIDDDEFKRVQDDLDDYKRQKSEIQNKMRNKESVNVEELKASFLEEGKKIGMKETMEKVQGLLNK
jgi:hypothetical protein